MIANPDDSRSTTDPQHAYEPTGMSVGGHGALRIFACLTCPGTPFVTDVQ